MRCIRVIRSRSGLVAIVAGACFALVNAGSVRAAVLWYDGFELAGAGGNYNAGADLGGQSGGSGTFFTGSWLQAGGDNHIVQTSSLTRPGQIQPSVGGSVSDASGPETVVGCCITSRSGRVFTDPWGGFTDPDGDFYFGFLADFGKGPTIHHRVIEAWEGTLGDGERHLQFGYSDFTGVGASQPYGRTMGISVLDSATNSSVNATLAENVNFLYDDGTTHYVVMKFSMSTSGNDVISVFLDPVGGVEPAPSAQVSVGQFLIDRFGVITTFTFGDHSAPAFDELRVGTTFADVQNNTLPYTPAPEPASLAILGLAISGLAAVRRKR